MRGKNGTRLNPPRTLIAVPRKIKHDDLVAHPFIFRKRRPASALMASIPMLSTGVYGGFGRKMPWFFGGGEGSASQARLGRALGTFTGGIFAIF